MTTESEITLGDLYTAIEEVAAETDRAHKRLDERFRAFEARLEDVVENKVAKVFDNHMGELKEILGKMDQRLCNLEQRES